MVRPMSPKQRETRVPWHGDEVNHEAFDSGQLQRKNVVIITFSDYDTVFVKVYTNAWYTQLGIVITQSKKKS